MPRAKAAATRVKRPPSQKPRGSPSSSRVPKTPPSPSSAPGPKKDAAVAKRAKKGSLSPSSHKTKKAVTAAKVKTISQSPKPVKGKPRKPRAPAETALIHSMLAKMDPCTTPPKSLKGAIEACVMPNQRSNIEPADLYATVCSYIQTDLANEHSADPDADVLANRKFPVHKKHDGSWRRVRETVIFNLVLKPLGLLLKEFRTAEHIGIIAEKLRRVACTDAFYSALFGSQFTWGTSPELFGPSRAKLFKYGNESDWLEKSGGKPFMTKGGTVFHSPPVVKRSSSSSSSTSKKKKGEKTGATAKRSPAVVSFCPANEKKAHTAAAASPSPFILSPGSKAHIDAFRTLLVADASTGTADVDAAFLEWTPMAQIILLLCSLRGKDGTLTPAQLKNVKHIVGKVAQNMPKLTSAATPFRIKQRVLNVFKAALPHIKKHIDCGNSDGGDSGEEAALNAYVSPGGDVISGKKGTDALPDTIVGTTEQPANRAQVRGQVHGPYGGIHGQDIRGQRKQIHMRGVQSLDMQQGSQKHGRQGHLQQQPKKQGSLIGQKKHDQMQGGPVQQPQKQGGLSPGQSAQLRAQLQKQQKGQNPQEVPGQRGPVQQFQKQGDGPPEHGLSPDPKAQHQAQAQKQQQKGTRGIGQQLQKQMDLPKQTHQGNPASQPSHVQQSTSSPPSRVLDFIPPSGATEGAHGQLLHAFWPEPSPSLAEGAVAHFNKTWNDPAFIVMRVKYILSGMIVDEHSRGALYAYRALANSRDDVKLALVLFLALKGMAAAGTQTLLRIYIDTRERSDGPPSVSGISNQLTVVIRAPPSGTGWSCEMWRRSVCKVKLDYDSTHYEAPGYLHFEDLKSGERFEPDDRRNRIYATVNVAMWMATGTYVSEYKVVDPNERIPKWRWEPCLYRLMLNDVETIEACLFDRWTMQEEISSAFGPMSEYYENGRFTGTEQIRIEHSPFTMDPRSQFISERNIPSAFREFVTSYTSRSTSSQSGQLSQIAAWSAGVNAMKTDAAELSNLYTDYGEDMFKPENGDWCTAYTDQDALRVLLAYVLRRTPNVHNCAIYFGSSAVDIGTKSTRFQSTVCLPFIYACRDAKDKLLPINRAACIFLRDGRHFVSYAVRTFAGKPGEIFMYFYDSLPGGRDAPFKRAFEAAAQDSKLTPTFVVIDGPRQPNGYDCGLYSVAFLTKVYMTKPDIEVTFTHADYLEKWTDKLTPQKLSSLKSSWARDARKAIYLKSSNAKCPPRASSRNASKGK